MSNFKNMKFRVESPEHSKAIQELLFELGYEWCSSGKEYLFFNEKFLFTHKSGQITYDKSTSVFKDNEGQERTLFDLQMMVNAKRLQRILTPITPNKPKQETMTKFKNSVIRVDKEESQQEEKPVEFTHFCSPSKGWVESRFSPNDFNKVLYLGKCFADGDMFAAYSEKFTISIYKGHLNSGKF